MDRELFRQGSTHCFDYTAFRALQNIEREEKKMENKTGEIWGFETNNGIMREAIILKDHGQYSTVLPLFDTDNGSCDVTVNCRGQKFTSTGKMQYVFENRFTLYIRTLTAEEFGEIMDKVAESLGLQRKEVIKEVVKEVPKEVKTTVIADNSEELARVQAQLEVYKTMYNDLLRMTVKGAV